MIAEESTAFPGVSRPVDAGGVGFGLKWDMGWMHDTLLYIARDPVHRRHHHGELTFRSVYAFSENFMLPLSHDEVVHGKGSLLAKMPGDDWQRFANLRLLFGYQFGQPGKKLLFMGDELAQRREWDHDGSLDWHLLDEPGPRRDPALGGRSQPALPGAACAARPRLRTGRLRLDPAQRGRDQPAQLPADVAGGSAGAGDLQLHPGATAERPGRRPAAGVSGTSCSTAMR